MGKIVMGFGLALFYCLSMNVGIFYSALPDTKPTSSSKQTHYFVTVSENIICPSVPTDKTVSTVKVFPIQNYKVHFKDLTFLQILFDHLLETQFDFNTGFLNQYHIQNHRFIITFPFHHFG